MAHSAGAQRPQGPVPTEKEIVARGRATDTLRYFTASR